MRMWGIATLAAGILTASSANAALVELRYLLTGDFIASWGQIGLTNVGEDNFTPVVHTAGPILFEGSARATTVWQSDGALTLFLGLSNMRITSDRSQLTTTPMLLTVTEDFEPPAAFQTSRSFFQSISGSPNFTANLQRTSIGMRSTVNGTDIAFISASREQGDGGFGLSANNNSQAPLTIGSTVRITSNYNIFLTSRGVQFTVTQVTTYCGVNLIPAPGVCALAACGGLIVVRRRRYP